MAVLDRLSATRLAEPWTEPAESAWARPIPTRIRTPVPVASFSWRSLAGNPNAIVLTGMIGAVAAKDAVVRMMAGA